MGLHGLHGMMTIDANAGQHGGRVQRAKGHE